MRLTWCPNVYMFLDMERYVVGFREGSLAVARRAIFVAFFEMIRLEKITVSSDGGCAGA